MRNDWDGKARQQACPECSAQPGQACVNRDHQPFRGLVHTLRSVAARHAAEEADRDV